MKIYIAAPYAAKKVLRDTTWWLETLEHEVTSTWLVEQHQGPGSLGPAPDLTVAQVAEHARTDLADVARSGVLVMITAEYCQRTHDLDPEQHRLMSGGRSVEMGYALAHDMPIVVVGEPENIFQRGLAHHVPDVTGLLNLLGKHAEDWA